MSRDLTAIPPFYDAADSYQYEQLPRMLQADVAGFWSTVTLKSPDLIPGNATLGPKAAPGLEADNPWWVSQIGKSTNTNNTFAGFETENIPGTAFPYTTLKQTTIRFIVGLFWDGFYQFQPKDDGSSPIDYSFTQNANGSLTITPVGAYDTTKAAQLKYIPTGETGGIQSFSATPQSPTQVLLNWS